MCILIIVVVVWRRCFRQDCACNLKQCFASNKLHGVISRRLKNSSSIDPARVGAQINQVKQAAMQKDVL